MPKPISPKRAAKIADARIEAVYGRRCSGVEIDIMDIGKVFGVGRAAIAEGADDVALGDEIVAFVQTIRKN